MYGWASGRLCPAGSDHEHAIFCDDGRVPFPLLIHCERAQHQRCDVLRDRRMNPKQNHAALFEGLPALNRDLPEIFIEGDQDSSVRFREFRSAASFAPG